MANARRSRVESAPSIVCRVGMACACHCRIGRYWHVHAEFQGWHHEVGAGAQGRDEEQLCHRARRTGGVVRLSQVSLLSLRETREHGVCRAS